MTIAKISLALALSTGLTAAYAQFVPPTGGSTPPTGAGPMPGGTTTASGSLTGSSVTVGYYYNDLATALTSSTVTVSSAVEVSCPDATLPLCASSNTAGNGLLDGEYIDIDATTISGRLLAAFTAESGDTFNGFTFSGLNFGTGYALTGFTLITNISGLDTSDISFTGNSLTMNWLGIDPSVTTDGSGIGTFAIALQVSALAVPEPASLMLMLCGLPLLAGVGLRRHRHQR